MKTLYFIFLCISCAAFGQNGLKLHLGCYSAGDTIPEEDLQRISTIDLYDHSSDKQIYNLYSWKVTIMSGGMERTHSNKEQEPRFLLPVMKKEMLNLNPSNTRIVTFEQIKIVKFDDFNELSYLSMPNVTFFVSKTAKSCAAAKTAKNKMTAYKGKLLTGIKAQVPLINQKVVLKNNKNKAEQSTVTDKYGDFNFDKIDMESSYSLEVAGDGPGIKDGVLYLAKQDGSNVRPLKKNGNRFVYELLPPELSRLSGNEVEDTDVVLKNFSVSKKNELTVVKDIYYELNSSQLNPEAKTVLDEIVNSLRKNNTLKLAILSHTDAQGDDRQNMELSQKRAKSVMDYLISKGIEKERLSMQGLGETKILNRCKNGVECSEMEHKLNRRTEFRFSKS